MKIECTPPQPSPVQGEGRCAHAARELRSRNCAPPRPAACGSPPSMLYRGRDRARLQARWRAGARSAGAADRGQRRAFPSSRPAAAADVLTCIRENLTIDRAGRKLAANAERFLKPPAEMARLFRDAPEAIAETLRLSEAPHLLARRIALRISRRADAQASPTPQDALAHLAYEGAAQRYPRRRARQSARQHRRTSSR